MARITFSLAFEKVRKVLARLTGRRQEDIKVSNQMNDFGFTEVGFERLANHLIAEFSLFKVDITANEVSEEETVGDLLDTTWSKIPDNLKEMTPFIEHILSNEGMLDAFSDEIAKTSVVKRVEKTLKS